MYLYSSWGWCAGFSLCCTILPLMIIPRLLLFLPHSPITFQCLSLLLRYTYHWAIYISSKMLVSHLAHLMSPKGSCCHVRLICSTLSATSSVSVSHLPWQLQARPTDAPPANVRTSSELCVAHFLCLLGLQGNFWIFCWPAEIFLVLLNFCVLKPDLWTSPLHTVLLAKHKQIFSKYLSHSFIVIYFR